MRRVLRVMQGRRGPTVIPGSRLPAIHFDSYHNFRQLQEHACYDILRYDYYLLIAITIQYQRATMPSAISHRNDSTNILNQVKPTQLERCLECDKLTTLIYRLSCPHRTRTT